VSPAWSADGNWLYFLSDRSLKTTVESPWGARQPEPHFDRPVKIYELALSQVCVLPSCRRMNCIRTRRRRPMTKPMQRPPDARNAEGKAPAAKSTVVSGSRTPKEVRIDFSDLQSRLAEVPVAPGNYDQLQISDKRLCWLDGSDEAPRKLALKCLEIANKGDEVETVASDIKSFEVSLDRKKLLVAKARNFYIVDSDVKAAAFSDQKVLDKSTHQFVQLVFLHESARGFPRHLFRCVAPGAGLFLRSQHAGGGLERHARALSAMVDPRLGP